MGGHLNRARRRWYMDANRIKVRVYYEDTDFGGVVYYAKYLRYLEQGRTEFFRDRGINLAECQKKGFVFAVTYVHIQYKVSARYDDLLDVETIVSDVRNASMTFDTKIYNQDGVTLVTSETKVACMNGRGRATRIPAEIMEKLNS
jgi:acyl-CoA thioester hydrolase